MTRNRPILPLLALTASLALVGCQQVRAKIMSAEGDELTIRAPVVIVGNPAQTARDYCAVRHKKPVLRDTQPVTGVNPTWEYRFSCVEK